MSPSIRRYRAELVALIALAGPIIVSKAGNVVMGVIDTLVAGRIGTTAIAALALAHTVFLLPIVFAMGIILGMDPLVAQAVGAGDFERQAKGFNAGRATALALGPLVVACAFVSPALLRYMGQPPDVVDVVARYLAIVAWSGPLMLLSVTISSYLAAHGRTAVLAPIAVVVNVANFFLSVGLGLGRFGLPDWGVSGIATATLACRLIEVAALAAWLAFAPSNAPLRVRWHRPDVPVLRQVWRTGLPVGVQYSLEFAGFGSAALLIGLISEAAVAAHQIAISVASLTFTIAMGVSAAASVRVAHAVGRRDLDGAQRAGWTAWGLGGLTGALFAVGLVATRDVIVGWYVEPGEVAVMAGSLLLIAGVFQLADMTQAIGFGVLRGLSDTRVPVLFNVLAYWFLALPIGGWLALNVTGRAETIWWGLTGALLLVALLQIARFRHLTRAMLAAPP